jgi:hypothetical protein
VAAGGPAKQQSHFQPVAQVCIALMLSSYTDLLVFFCGRGRLFRGISLHRWLYWLTALRHHAVLQNQYSPHADDAQPVPAADKHVFLTFVFVTPVKFELHGNI